MLEFRCEQFLEEEAGGIMGGRAQRAVRKPVASGCHHPGRSFRCEETQCRGCGYGPEIGILMGSY